MKPRALLFAAALVLAAATGGTSADPTDARDLGLDAAAGPFDLVLTSCTFLAERLECLLTAYNRLDTSARIGFDGARFYDTEGKLYRDAEIRLGGESDLLPNGHRKPAATTAPGDTGVQVVIVFTDVSRYKQKAANLVVELSGRRDAEFGSFPLARD